MLFVSDGCLNLTGYKPEDVMINHAISFGEIILEEDRSGVHKQLEAAILARERIELEYRILRADGKVYWVLEKGEALRDERGNVEALEGFIQDITRYKQNEAAAMRAEERYRSIFENAIEGIYQTNLSGQYLNFNPALARIYGYESPEDLARSISDIQNQLYVDPGKRREFIDLMREFGSVQNFEARIYRKNGDIIWITENAREVHDKSGNILFYEGTVEDITGRKQMEDQVHQLAYYDALTQLPNRRLLNDRMNQAMSAGRRNKYYGAMIFLDLDNFKPLNDTHGHAVGDLLLVEVATRLKNCVREMDTVSRFGGDEFVVMLGKLETDKAASISQAATVAEKIRTALALPYRLAINQSGHAGTVIEHQCTSSIGVVLFSGLDSSQEEIHKRADMAMYQAKQAGGNSVWFSDT